MTDYTKLQVGLISSLSSGATERMVVRNIFEELISCKVKAEWIEVHKNPFRELRHNLQTMRHQDVLVFHSPFIFQVIYILLGRLLGKTTIGLVWDIYPVIVDGKRYDSRITRKITDAFERLAQSSCSLLLVPTRDFLSNRALRNAVFLPMWYRPNAPERASSVVESYAGERITRVLFAGQVNATRGLPEAIARLEIAFPDGFELLIASADKLPEAILSHQSVQYVGFRSRDELCALAQRCDCGLVSLAHGLAGAGFPSKTFDYLSWGLPCVYSGPDLPHYLDLLTCSGAGIVLSRAGTQAPQALDAISNQISGRRDEFFRQTVFSPTRFLKLLHSLAMIDAPNQNA